MKGEPRFETCTDSNISRQFEVSQVLKMNQERFKKIQKIGEGTYGVVYKAFDVEKRHHVALKKIHIKRWVFVIKISKQKFLTISRSETEGVPSTTIREISILKELKHHSVVELFDIIVSRADIFMVFEYLDMDLKKLLEKNSEVFTPKLIKVRS